MKRNHLLLILSIYGLSIAAQNIGMEFPAFAGNSYDFIIFQGSKTVSLTKGRIPENGKFTLTIPEQYAPYTGMCRWLISGSSENAGMDMAVPGHDFFVSCSSVNPSKDNITYTNFDPVTKLDKLNATQEQIIEKFNLCNRALELYKDHKEFAVLFKAELNKQKEAFISFQEGLKKDPNFNARLIPILNLTRGIAPQLTSNPIEKAEIYNLYVTQSLSFKDLYVSGHWTALIRDWVTYQSNEVNDIVKFEADFKRISARIDAPELYTDFVGKVTYYLTSYSKDAFVDALAETVLQSGKITAYTGSMQVYIKSRLGMKAANLTLPKTPGNNKALSTLESSKFALNGANKTLLVFYNSACGPCEELMRQLPDAYPNIKKSGLDIIAISSDTDAQEFKNQAEAFPWKRSYCDLKGLEGPNFLNYGVVGTPMLFLIDQQGTIVAKPNWLDFLKDWSPKKN